MLINLNANIHVDNENALFWSIKNNYFDIFKLLVNNGANIHVKNDFALQLAAKNGNMKIVKFLVENDAQIDADNYVALVKSAEYGCIYVFEYLTNKLDNIDIIENLLIISANNGHLISLKYIVATYINLDFNSALISSIKKGHFDIVKLYNEYLYKC